MNIDPDSIANFLNGVNGVNSSKIVERIKQRRGTWNYDHVRCLDVLEQKIPKDDKTEPKEMMTLHTRVPNEQRQKRQFGIGRSTINRKKNNNTKPKLKKFGIAKKKAPSSPKVHPSPPPVKKNTAKTISFEEKKVIVEPAEPMKSIDSLLENAKFPTVIRNQVAKVTMDSTTSQRVEELVKSRKMEREDHEKQLEKERQEKEKEEILDNINKNESGEAIPDVKTMIDNMNVDSDDDIVPMPVGVQQPTVKEEELSPLKLPTRPVDTSSPLKLPTKSESDVKVVNVNTPRRRSTQPSKSETAAELDPSTKVVSLVDRRENKVAVDYNNMSRDDALVYLLRSTPGKIRSFKVDKLKQFCKALGISYKGTKAKTSVALIELRDKHAP